ncbi:MAG: hypothetical protein SGILL_005621 [Bacillariaceae sp.]
MTTSVPNTPISGPAGSTSESGNIKQAAPSPLHLSEAAEAALASSSKSAQTSGMSGSGNHLTVETSRNKNSNKLSKPAAAASRSTSEASADLRLQPPNVPALGSTASEPATPTMPYSSSVDQVTPKASTPTISNQHMVEQAPPSKKDKANKSSSLRKAGSKIVKAGVVRPARAVTRVFRSSSSKGTSEESAAILRKSSSGERGEIEAAIQHNGGVALSLNNPNGYGTMNGSNRVIVANNSMQSVDGTVVSGFQGSCRSNAVQDPATAGSTANWPVHSMEALTRQIFLVCVAYMVGVNYPEYLQHVSRATEFAATAWITCIAILCLSFLQRRFPHAVMSERDKHNLLMAAGAVLDENEAVDRGLVSNEESVPLLRGRNPNNADTAPRDLQPLSKANRAVSCPEHPMPGDEYMMPLASESPAIEPSSSWEEASVASAAFSQGPEVKVEHPSLAPFYVIDAYSGERIFCNSSAPHRISNEWFEMDILCMLRTPDVDDESAVRGTPSNDRVADYLRGKARRWEFQYRVKLKKKPEGKSVYFACELGEPIKMGMVTKAFASAAMSFMKKTNPTFHYSITGSNETPDGKWESPHMSFTVEGSLDRLVVTKPGEEPPKLGGAIHEDPESIKKRKKGELIDWNTEDTYTMALWTSYADFLQWKAMNLPGLRPFALTNMLGTQPINLTMYLIDDKRDTDKHYRRDITEIIKFELSNDQISGLGPAALSWKNQSGQRPRISSLSHQHSRSGSEDSGMLGRTLDLEPIASADDDFNPDQTGKTRLSVNTSQDMDDIEEVDEDVLTAAELGEGIYLRSGDSVVLREFTAEDEAIAGSCSVANGGGFAVLQEQDVAIVIEKAKKNKKNKLIKSGDTVLFKMSQNKAGSDDVETRYLTIHRGWWLKWVTTMPTKNGYFTIYTHETELGDKTLPTDETQSSFLTLGGTFTLRHKRWSKFQVGIAAEPSTTYGGRLLGIYNPKSKGNPKEEEEKPNYHSDDEDDFDKEMPMGKAGWLKPLVLSVHESSALVDPDLPRTNSSMDADEDAPDLAFVSPTTKIIFSSEHSKADVPAWIEMMDRVGRKRQLAYVVRVTRRLPAEESKLDENEDYAEEDQGCPDNHRSFMRLRSGKELAHIMSIGQSVRYPTLDLKPYSHSGSFDEAENIEIEYEEPHSPVRRLNASRSEGDDPLSPAGSARALRHASYTGGMSSSDVQSNEERMRRRATADHARSTSFDEEDVEEDEDIEESGYGGYNSDGLVMDECYVDDDSSLSDSVSSEEERERKGALKKGKKLLGKSAKLAKKTVVGTGKLTAKTAVGTTKLAASK